MRATTTAYREVRCRNERCPRVLRGLDPMILCKARPGSEVILVCRACKVEVTIRVPMNC